MSHRRGFKQTLTLKDRLAAFANVARKKAEQLPPGPQQNELVRKARQADITAHLDDWINSPGLQPPK